MADNLIEILKDEKVRNKYTLLPAQNQVAFAWRTNWLSLAHDHQIRPETGGRSGSCWLVVEQVKPGRPPNK
jgi:hypothetical protein